MAEKIPSTVKLIPDSVIAQWPCWSKCEPLVIRQLTGGLTNTSFLIQAQQQKWVLRINAKNSAELNLDRNTEYKILSLPSIDQLAPHLIYCDPEKKFLVTEYLPGKTWTSKSAAKPKNIIDLALLLKSIHQLGIVDDTLDCQQKASNYWQHIDSNNSVAAAAKTLQPTMLWHFEQARANCTHHSLCHNDLLSSNLLTVNNKRLYAIDWEYAAMGDPYFDLAVIVEGHELGERQIDLLLKTYLGNTTDKKLLTARKRLIHSQIIYCYLTLLWHLLQSKAHPSMDNICEKKLIDLNTALSRNI